MRRIWCLAIAGIVAAALTAPAAADITPRFWGTSYAIVIGSGNSVLGSQNRPVRVSARLPAQLSCARVFSVDRQRVARDVVLRDPMAAAPVTVTVDSGRCRGDWRDNWLQFVVPGPTGSDILDISVVGHDGRLLSRERVAVETSTGEGRD